MPSRSGAAERVLHNEGEIYRVTDAGGHEALTAGTGIIECAAAAADGHNALAMLVRREGETLNALSSA